MWSATCWTLDLVDIQEWIKKREITDLGESGACQLTAGNRGEWKEGDWGAENGALALKMTLSPRPWGITLIPEGVGSSSVWICLVWVTLGLSYYKIVHKSVQITIQP